MASNGSVQRYDKLFGGDAPLSGLSGGLSCFVPVGSIFFGGIFDGSDKAKNKLIIPKPIQYR